MAEKRPASAAPWPPTHPQLLRTKLYVPQTRPGLVARPRLSDRLDALLERKLAVLSAPAGFGKTTILSVWAAHCRQRGLPVAWVSLDDGAEQLSAGTMVDVYGLDARGVRLSAMEVASGN